MTVDFLKPASEGGNHLSRCMFIRERERNRFIHGDTMHAKIDRCNTYTKIHHSTLKIHHIILHVDNLFLEIQP